MKKNAIQSLNRLSGEDLRIKTMTENMHENLAYFLNMNDTNDKSIFLKHLKEKYLRYRLNWNKQPRDIIKDKIDAKELHKKKIYPLCVDIETAAICDLACPHCYRQFIVTPDKIISDDLCFKIIDQAADMDVPSIKFNWRGEPLMHPRLSKFIYYAKKLGVLETIINTNATKLTPEMSEKLIDSGLDILIFSFDGGTKKTYEKMRPGRFDENSFDEIYKNIKNFKKIRDAKKKKLPITKVQMVLTEDTFNEQSSFFNLFKDIVDDVSVKQYTERGGELEYLKKDLIEQNKIDKKLNNSDLLRDPNGDLFISTGRLPCEQPYQRMLVTYDGRVSMCCYDWGSMHPVGYLDTKAIEIDDKDYEAVRKKIISNKKGFEMMKPEMPRKFNNPKREVNRLNEIWFGPEMNSVRCNHMDNKLENIEICKMCPFKETYRWEKVNTK